MELRRALAEDVAGVRALVQAVVDEIYGGLWASPPLPIGDDDWSLAWVAIDDDAVVRVALTGGDWLDDLWIARGWRDRGIGARLLAIAEREIAARGHPVARLSVIASNVAARRFYARHGWQEARTFRTDVVPADKIEMTKAITPAAGSGARAG